MFDRDAEAAKVEPVNTLQQAPSQEPVSPVRRRLLQSSTLALPAILTLQSGSAGAVASIVCRVKEYNKPPGPGTVPAGVSLLTTEDTPAYVRVELGGQGNPPPPSSAPPPAPGGGRGPVRDGQNNFAPRAIIYYDHISRRWRRADTGALLTRPALSNTDPGGADITSSTGKWWALAFFDDTGSPVRALGPTNVRTPPTNLLPNNKPLVAISDTCWASI